MFTPSIFLYLVFNILVQYLRIDWTTCLKAFIFPSWTTLSHSDGWTAPEVKPSHHRRNVPSKYTITLHNGRVSCITKCKEKLKRADPPLQACSLASGFAGHRCLQLLVWKDQEKNGKNKPYLRMIAVASFKMQLAESVHESESVHAGSGGLTSGQRNQVWSTMKWAEHGVGRRLSEWLAKWDQDSCKHKI